MSLKFAPPCSINFAGNPAGDDSDGTVVRVTKDPALVACGASKHRRQWTRRLINAAPLPIYFRSRIVTTNPLLKAELFLK